ncbi:baseplate assembly protein [Achromobacter sp. Root83]|uniref:baseplate J/gp47 family protein n=1 Tax=Achromobacter sp. Root83 TaxID=1736602 RepID=UPI00071060D2|nr:baseplate J/gp47 family protein [Achromobacter sp. Root83]KRC85442.1 baseplate assembly protein [Achromobacter sp. Root83]
MANPNIIDLSQLPAPDVVEALDYEQILETRKARYLALFAQEDQDAIAKALTLESEPLVVVLQENAEREVILRQRVNDAARSVLLAFARGKDLEHIAAEHGVSRQVIQPANPDALPPVDAVYESDDELCERAQMAWEGLSTAGPRDGYVFHALSADGLVADATATSPDPCDILVCVLSREGDGTAAPELLAKVAAKLNDEDIRPMGDRVTVQSSQILPYRVRAVLHMKGEGPGRTVALDAARAACAAYVNRPRRAGVSVWRSALTASLHVEGVDHLDLLEPADDLVMTATQAATCADIDLSIAVEA